MADSLQTGDPLLQKLASLKAEFFGEYHTNLDTNRQYYELDFAKDIIPEGWTDRLSPIIPPTARRAIDEMADHILFNPKIRVPVRPTTSKHVTEQQIAEAKRKFLNAYWSQVTQRYNPIGDGRKLLLREGRICIRHTLKWDLIPDREKMSARKYRAALNKLVRYEFLWQDELLDNRTVFEDPSNHRDPAYVFIEYDVLAEEAKRLFPDASGSWRMYDDYAKVTYTEYWTRPTFNPDGTWDSGDFVQWINDEKVNEDENPYPYIPIAIEDAGFGDNYQGVRTAQKYVGLSQHTHSMFVAEARQMTSWEAVTEITAFPPIYGHNLDPSKIINVGPGEIIPLEGTPGESGAEEIEIAKWPEVPQGVIRLVDKTTAYANDALKMDTLSGTPLPGVNTATEADQQIRNASSKLQGPIAALERLAVKINRWTLMDVELLHSPVSVYGTQATDPAVATLSPGEIRGYYDSSCEFTTSDADAVSQVKARFWAEMYRVVPFLSAMTAMERGEIADDPMHEMVRRSAEDVLMSAEMRSIRTLTAAQAYGQLAEMIAAMQEQGGPSETTGLPVRTGLPSGANSGEGLIAQPEILQAPERQAISDMSLVNRDILRGDSQLR